MYDPLISVRGALLTTSNTTGGDSRTGVGGNEIQKMIDRLIVDDVNSEVDFRPLVPRKVTDQKAYIWNVRTDLGSTSKAAFYGSGAAGTPYPSSKTQLVAQTYALRADYEVTGIMLAASSSYYDALADEAQTAVREMGLAEEKSFLCGTDTSAYGLASGYDGLLQLMGSNATFSDTDTIYGTARASARDELDVSLVAAGATSQDALELKDLDEAIRKSNDKGAKTHKRIFLCSTARQFEISQLLQPQGRFVLGAASNAQEGGTFVISYLGIPIVGSRFMDKNGITWNGSVKTKSYTDAAMYLLDMDNIEFRSVAGVDMVHVPIVGSGTTAGTIRADVVGGYFKTYGTFVMKRFQTQVLIYNLSVP